MKSVFFFLCLMISGMIMSQDLKEYRALLKTGEKSEKSAKLLIDKSDAAYEKTRDPLYAGFSAVGHFFMAKHVFNPLKKMSYFNQGKNTLDQAVKSDPKNLEIRLMRLIAQENTPKILGYNGNIAEDRKFLTKEYTKTDDQFLKTYIREYLKL